MFLLLVLIPIKAQDISPLIDTKSLSELPLEKLLQVQSTFKESEPFPIEEKISVNTPGPEALALQAKRKPNERGGYQYHYEEENSKKSGKKSVQSIFQISVTALAFLAFGGYLVCLLVQAIKGKTAVMTIETTTIPAIAPFIARPTIRRRKPTRRPIRQQQRPYPYPRRPKRDIWPQIDSESMYYALVDLSEAYTRYHTIDYTHFNYTTNLYAN